MTQHTSHFLVYPEAVVSVCAQPELDRLPGVDVEPEEVRLLVGCELGQRVYGEAVLLHDVLYCGVGGEFVEI